MGETNQSGVGSKCSSELVKAICKVMGEVGPIAKDGHNSQQNYDFTTEASIANTLRPLMAKHGLALVPSHIEVLKFDAVDARGGGKLNRVAVSATYLLLHESGDSLAITVPSEGMDSFDKSVQKSLTAAFKYTLLQMFCVGRGADGESGEGYEGRKSDPNESENAALRRAAAVAAAEKAKSAKPATGGSAAPPGDFRLSFGKNKGDLMSTVDNDYLNFLIGAFENNLADPEKSKYHATTKTQLEACRKEWARRLENAGSEPDPFDGMDPGDVPF